MPFGLHLHNHDAPKWVRSEIPASTPSYTLFTENLAIGFPKSYTRGRKVGDGSEGCVETWTHKDSGDVVAVKIIKHKNMMPREVEVLKDLRPHKAIVQIYAFFQKQPNPTADCMLFEYCAAGDLFDLQHIMWRKNYGRFSEAFLWSIFRQIAEALAFLHEGTGCPNPHNADFWRPIVHRDVKLENIFITTLGTKDDYSTLQIKLGDFGLSAFYDPQNSQMPGHWGTSILWPPEQTWEGRVATPAGDVWALGCIIHEFAHQFPPVVDIEITERLAMQQPNPPKLPASWCALKKRSFWGAATMRKALPINLESNEHAYDKRRYRPTPKYSDELNDCLQLSLTIDVKDRPTAVELKEKLEEQEAGFHFEELWKENVEERNKELDEEFFCA